VACNVGIVDVEGDFAGWDHTNFSDRVRDVLEAAGSLFISTPSKSICTISSCRLDGLLRVPR
jgi:hypothetical protein